MTDDPLALIAKGRAWLASAFNCCDVAQSGSSARSECGDMKREVTGSNPVITAQRKGHSNNQCLSRCGNAAQRTRPISEVLFNSSVLGRWWLFTNQTGRGRHPRHNIQCRSAGVLQASYLWRGSIPGIGSEFICTHPASNLIRRIFSPAQSGDSLRLRVKWRKA